jgi:hypothetical protein
MFLEALSLVDSAAKWKSFSDGCILESLLVFLKALSLLDLEAKWKSFPDFG